MFHKHASQPTYYLWHSTSLSRWSVCWLISNDSSSCLYQVLVAYLGCFMYPVRLGCGLQLLMQLGVKAHACLLEQSRLARPASPRHLCCSTLCSTVARGDERRILIASILFMLAASINHYIRMLTIRCSIVCGTTNRLSTIA